MATLTVNDLQLLDTFWKNKAYKTIEGIVLMNREEELMAEAEDKIWEEHRLMLLRNEGMKMSDAEKENYKYLLTTHDWSYEYSDDHRVYTKGREEKNKLYWYQERIDQNFTTWNEYAPEGYKRNV
mgnify:CR=1 FL=1